MNKQQLRDNPNLLGKLAAEFVLGTLRGGARRRFEGWLQEEPLVRQAVAEWQEQLQPMAELTPAVQPSQHVWRSIEKELNLAAARTRQSRRSFWLGLREDLSFWRGLGMASTAFAAILVTVLLARQPEPAVSVPSYVATLADEKAQPVILITGDIVRRELTVKVITAQNIPADKSLELWALPQAGAPRSLGLVAANGTVTLPMPADASPQNLLALAISLEPKGGSPKPNAPTGPVLFKGAWVQI